MEQSIKFTSQNKDEIDKIEETEEDRIHYDNESKIFFRSRLYEENLKTLQDVLDLSISQLQQILKSNKTDLGQLRFELLHTMDSDENISYLTFYYKEGYENNSFKLSNYDSSILHKILNDVTDELDLKFEYTTLEKQINPKLFYTKRLSKMILFNRLNILTGEKLIKLGASVNDDMLSANYNDPEILEFLLRHGANPSFDKEWILRNLASLNYLHKINRNNGDYIKCANLAVKYGASIPDAILYAKQKEASKQTIQNLKDFLKTFPYPDAKVAK